VEGHLVVLIDFQRSSIVEESDEYEYRIVQAVDEISLAYELMKKWIPHGAPNEIPKRKAKLNTLMNDIMSASNVKEMVDIIDAFV
jgi:hypothetical protein